MQKKYLILFECAAVIVRRGDIYLVTTKNVSGKQPFPRNQSSPKSTSVENSTIQGCMQNIICASNVQIRVRFLLKVVVGNFSRLYYYCKLTFSFKRYNVINS